MTGNEIPNWFSYPEVITELKKSYPPKYKQGITLFFTGLSGSGKSTLANALRARLMSIDERKITLLDGDCLRGLLGNKLGFSKEDRSVNIRLLSFLASEIMCAGGIVICAAIAPYQTMRDESRQMISQKGHFIEIHLSTALATCEERDPKGLYAKARLGEIKNFTGIDDLYEIPKNPEISIDTSLCSIRDSIEQIINFMRHENFLNGT